jgi:hypothetical protein
MTNIQRAQVMKIRVRHPSFALHYSLFAIRYSSLVLRHIGQSIYGKT